MQTEGRKGSHPVNAYISMCNKRSCLQFHISSPCAILFHGLAVFIEWDIILDKWFKHFAILLLITVPMSDYLQVGYPIKKMDLFHCKLTV